MHDAEMARIRIIFITEAYAERRRSARLRDVASRKQRAKRRGVDGAHRVAETVVLHAGDDTGAARERRPPPELGQRLARESRRHPGAREAARHSGATDSGGSWTGAGTWRTEPPSV